MLYTDFDVAAYGRAEHSRIVVDSEAVAATGVDEDTRADLAFLWRLDSAGLSEARAILAAWTANEARITAFVSTWAFERQLLARATRDLLTATGPLARRPRQKSVRARLRGVYVERVLPLVVPVWTAVVGEPVVAGHMARLAVQEGALQAAYGALLPRLTGEAARVVEEIVRRRDDMVRFFRLEAAARIARSNAEATAARLHLGGDWKPLRVVGVADPDERRALPSLFRTEAARTELARADAAIRELIPSRESRKHHLLPPIGRTVRGL